MPERIECRLKFLKEEKQPVTFTSIREAWFHINAIHNKIINKRMLPISKIYRALRGPGYLDFGMDTTTNPSSWKHRIEKVRYM